MDFELAIKNCVEHLKKTGTTIVKHPKIVENFETDGGEQITLSFQTNREYSSDTEFTRMMSAMNGLQREYRVFVLDENAKVKQMLLDSRKHVK